MDKLSKYLTILACVSLISGCALQVRDVKVTTNETKVDRYEFVANIKLRIHKTTIFESNPTDEDAYQALLKVAKELGADTVINPKYTEMWWFGYMDAEGIAVRYKK